ncbi:MAG: exodeoxyribonuclease III [Lentisphaeria bacterium]|nr:exodeoxyribonuclease III [Lentisphaeria bacterium]
MKTILSWNVNGIRAVQKKGFLEWLLGEAPDVLCVQETKAAPEQLDEALLHPPGYRSVWRSAERRGYSGVAAYVREEPLDVEGLGASEFDIEGRMLILHYPDLTILNAYFPNSQPEGARLGYKISYCAAVLEKCSELVAAGRTVLLCGDYNIAHKPIDLANPKANEGSPGYLPEERAWMDRFTASGYVDTFRMFCGDPGQYTWWSYMGRARAKNIGWRIDYHCVNEAARSRVRGAGILAGVMGSDHCPVRVLMEC